MEEKMTLDDDVNVDVLLNSTKVSQQDFDSVIVKVSELHFDRYGLRTTISLEHDNEASSIDLYML